MAENPRIEELRRRVQADPASIAFAALAEEFRRVGRYEDAIETCRNGLQRHPAYLSARVTLGRALIETGDYDGAREELETVLRSAPENLAATRGLATIHERLGHSTEMDPHLADMMKTMHAESIRVPVTPPEPVDPEPAIAALIEPEPPFQPEPQFQPPPQLTPEQRFEAEPQFNDEPEFKTEPPQIRPQIDGHSSWGDPARRAEPQLDLSLAPPLGDFRAPDPDLGTMVEPESEPDLEIAAPSGVDAEALATLARLERFLGAIQSLRA
jgi:tetratricopeptide (TPR) repeat protein